jgi:adenosylcobinamide kinase/adenosylcobinamide-phosphate guanylyltransferase
MGETVLILGGARSGKSRLAESLAREGEPVTYVATSLRLEDDPEMMARIDRHRASRPQHWTTMELPRGLESTLPALVARDGSVVIDCVTLWVTNMMLGLGGPALDDGSILAAVEQAARAARGAARAIWVSNEVGGGVIPVQPTARRFADLQGLANQRLAAACDVVHLCVAGLSVRLK